MSVLVLVVDDEPDIAELFRQQFRRETRAGKFVLAFASSGRDALECLADPDSVRLILILSDVNMPGMTGIEFLSLAKKARPEVPVIMITAYGDAKTRREAELGGADAFVVKPIDFVALRGEIDRRLAG